MDIDLNDGKDRIGPMFRDRHVLITGGTGFMGKALVEKLMRLVVKTLVSKYI